MAVVYLGIDTKNNNKKVAIKALNTMDFKNYEISLKRFKREAQLASQVTGSHVVKIYDVISDDPEELIIQEYVEGSTLNDKISEYGKLTLEESINYLKQICEGANSIHEQEIVHRDLKPENILISKNGTVKITDFGIALYNGARNQHTISGNIVGTLKYIAPELLSHASEGIGEHVTALADIYSIGIIFYEMIQGSVPISPNDVHEAINYHYKESLPKISSKNNNIPRSVDEIIQKCTQKNMAKRYQSVNEIIIDLNKILNGEEIKNYTNHSMIKVPKRYYDKIQNNRESHLPFFAKKSFIFFGLITVLIIFGIIIILEMVHK